jgi:hypothetical protein
VAGTGLAKAPIRALAGLRHRRSAHAGWTTIRYIDVLSPRGRPDHQLRSRPVARNRTDVWARPNCDPLAAEESSAHFYQACLGMLSAAAGSIHLVAAFPHFAESNLKGVFFVASGLAQLVAGGLLVYRSPASLLAANAAGNALIIAIWVMSRTTGIPLEPNAWTPEPVGVADTAASVFELLTVAGSVLHLLPSGRALVARAGPRKPAMALITAASVLMFLSALSFVSVGTEKHHHHSAMLDQGRPASSSISMDQAGSRATRRL